LSSSTDPLFYSFSLLPDCLYFLSIYSRYSYYPYVRKRQVGSCRLFHNFWLRNHVFIRGSFNFLLVRE
ncbi:hypothetical protein GIB67_023013, partial [Kingdonia uniflora]